MIVAEMLAREGQNWLTMWLNGLNFVRLCYPIGTNGFGARTNPTCITNQSAITPMHRLPAYVQNWTPGTYVALMGAMGIDATGAPRFASQSIWVVAGAGASGKPRPYFGPLVPAPPVISYAATLARPGFVPRDVRPWPVWSVGSAPAAPSPVPLDDSDTGGMRRPAPGYGRWEWAQPGTRPEVITRPETPAIVRSPPRTWEREVKIGANTPTARFFFALMQAREKVSELDDIVGVMFQALPANIRRRAGRSEHAQRVAVVEYFGQIDWQAFLRGMVANQIEDEIIGRTYFQARGATRNLLHGNQIGSMGPVNTPGFKEYSASVSDLAKMLANDMFGPTTKEREAAQLKALWRAERARRRLQREANQSLKGQGQSRPRNN